MAIVGRVTLFAFRTVISVCLPPYYPGRVGEQLIQIGWLSLPVVGLTAIFTGAALAQQIYTGGMRFNAQSTVPAIVVIGMVRELGPVLVGLMVSGRVTSAMAAELGDAGRRLDAMTTLRTDPYRYLIAPRLLAGVISLPILVLVADAIGILGAYLLSIGKLHFNAQNYLSVSRQFLEADDIVMSSVKAGVFGLLHMADGVLRRLQHQGRRRRGRHVDDQCGGFVLCPDPARQSAHHRDCLRMSVPKIELTDVAKRFGRNVVLDGLNLKIEPGESVAIIGGSGTGKSVTLKCILGLLKPERGSIKVDGEELLGAPSRGLRRIATKFGMLFQGSALFDSMSVWRNVTFALTQGRATDVARMRDIALENLERVGLGREVLHLRPSELSGGMQKRVALARAIAARPEIIFFDEPTTGLDPIRADVINDLITSLVENLGVTAVTITHDMASARKIAHRVAMLYQGRIVWHGPRDRLYDSGNPYVDQFVQGRAEGPIQAGSSDVLWEEGLPDI